MHPDEIPVGRAKDLRGQVIGEWTVLYRTISNNPKHTNWKCKCNKCGNEYIIRADTLLKSKAFGCVHCAGKNNIKDLTGKIFEDLLVLEATNERKNGVVVWKCQNINTKEIIYLRTDVLQSHKAGQHSKRNINLLSMSKGEIIIFLTLKNNNINFECQKTFNNLKYDITNGIPRFDFWVENKYIIECDGEQHYTNVDFFNNSTLSIVDKDIIKNQWCKDNNIPLIRIPYWHLQDLCIEDLLLETSKFIIGE